MGVVTSTAAAALRDILTTLQRRWPALRAIVYPAAVQGAGAAQEIALAIRTAGIRAEVDILVVCRGGGSIEDLWAFNEEAVAQAVFESPIPIVSGVGHETDFTICDFVADARAPTPTAAAARAAPDREAVIRELAAQAARLARSGGRMLETRMQRIDSATAAAHAPSGAPRATSARGRAARHAPRACVPTPVGLASAGRRRIAATPDAAIECATAATGAARGGEGRMAAYVPQPATAARRAPRKPGAEPRPSEPAGGAGTRLRDRHGRRP